MRIHPVTTKQDLSSFLNLPYRLYKNDPVWVPPLRDEQRGQFDPKRNPLLDHCLWQLFLLEDAGEYIGRIAAFIDVLAIDFWKERVGLFGYYECIPDLPPAGCCSKQPGNGCAARNAPICAARGRLFPRNGGWWWKVSSPRRL